MVLNRVDLVGSRVSWMFPPNLEDVERNLHPRLELIPQPANDFFNRGSLTTIEEPPNTRIHLLQNLFRFGAFRRQLSAFRQVKLAPKQELE